MSPLLIAGSSGGGGAPSGAAGGDLSGSYPNPLLSDALISALVSRGDQAGYLWEACERATATQNLTPTGGVLYLFLVHWPYRAKANPTLDMFIQTAGAIGTSAGQNFAALYPISASASASVSVGIDSWLSGTGIKSAAFTIAAASLPSGGPGSGNSSYMLAAMLISANATMPVFKGAPNPPAALVNQQNVANRPFVWNNFGTAQTALPTGVNTQSGLTAAGGSLPVWAALR